MRYDVRQRNAPTEHRIVAEAEVSTLRVHRNGACVLVLERLPNAETVADEVCDE